MALETDFNVSPYYDDYDESKDYHKVLFKPAVALQARELTQLQTILQNQVEKFGHYVFKEGSIVKGCVFGFSKSIDYVKLLDKTIAGTDLNVSLISSGDYLRGQNANLVSRVVDTASGLESQNPDLNTLFFNYLNSDDTTTQYSNGEILEVYPATTSIANIQVTSAGLGLSNSDTVVISSTNGGNATANVITNANGAVTSINVTANGAGFTVDDYPTASITTSNSSATDATLRVNLNETMRVTVGNSSFFDAGGNTQFNVTGKAYQMTVGDGVIFQKGIFQRFTEQDVIVSKYTNRPHERTVGIQTTETTVNSSVDSTLLDNASGFANENAPGADRLQLKPTLVVNSKATADSSNNFLKLAEFQYGAPIQKNSEAMLSDLGDRLAKRTFEESGNYVVEPFTLSTEQITGNTSHLAITVGSGVGYNQGHRFETAETLRIPLPKAQESINVASQQVSINFGNYIELDNVVGEFGIETNDMVLILEDKFDAISGGAVPTLPAASNTTVTYHGVTADVIGTARVRGLEQAGDVPGKSDTKYNLYLYDIQMQPGQTFSKDAQSIWHYKSTEYSLSGAETNSSVSGAGNIVLDNNLAKLKDTGFDGLVFPVGQKGLKSVGSAGAYTFRKRQTATANTTGKFALTGLSADQSFGIGASGHASEVQEKDFIIVPTASKNAATVASSTADVADSSTLLVTGGATSTLRAGDYVYVDSTLVQVNAVVNSTTFQTVSAVGASKTNVNVLRTFPKHYPISLHDRTNANIAISAANSIVVSLDTDIESGGVGVSIIHNVVDSNESGRAKVVETTEVGIDTASNAGGTSGPWSLGVPDVFELTSVLVGPDNTYTSVTESDWSDVTSKFEIISNQKDGSYGLSKLRIKPNSGYTIGSDDHIAVKFRHFKESGSGKGFFHFGSYSSIIDDANTANTDAITTQEIPIFGSPISGREYSLRDSIDFRPFVANTATMGGAFSNGVGTSTENPSAVELINADSFISVPNKLWSSSIEYYLPRKDRLINEEGNLRIIHGEPSINPQLPEKPSKAMQLGTIDVPVFPSLSTEEAKFFKRPDLGVTLRATQLKRYTMEDIKNIDQRVKNLEYYSSLNLLEKQTSDLVLPGRTNAALNRFKNGFIVDNFVSRTTGNPLNSEFKAGYDIARQQLTAKFEQYHIDMKFSSGANISRTGDLITPIYKQRNIINQNKATQDRRCTSAFWHYNGNLRLFPDYLSKTDTVKSPLQPVQIDIDAASGTLALLEELNKIVPLQSTSEEVINEEQETRLTSVTETDTTRTETFETIQHTTVRRTTTGLQGTEKTTTKRVGEFVTDISFQPYIPGVDIRFVATGLRPNLRHYVYFDGVDVNEHVLPAIMHNHIDSLDALETVTSTRAKGIIRPIRAKGQQLTANTSGGIAGVLRLPADTFFAGERKVVITDVSNLSQSDDIVSSATARFNCFNFSIETNDIITSTRQAEITQTRLDDVQTTSQVVNTSEIVTTINAGPGSNTTENNTPNTISNNILFPPFEGNTPPFVPPRANTGTGRGRIEPRIPIRIGDVNPFGMFGGDGFFNPLDFPMIYMDPLAQSFMVDASSFDGETNGYLTSLDLFFSSKDANMGVTVQLQEMQNGTPSTKVLPFSKVHLSSSQVNTSTDGSSATTINFSAPVAVKTGKEYCFVVLPDGNSPEYKVFTARAGQKDLNTGISVNQDWGRGTMFLSTNNRTWTEYLDEDVKFIVRQAVFSNQRATVDLVNEDYEFFTANNGTINGTFQQGEEVFKLASNATGNVQFTTGNSLITGVGTNFTSPTLAAGDTIVLTINSTSFDVLEINSVANTTSLTVRGAPKFSSNSINGRYMFTPVGNFVSLDAPTNTLLVEESSATNSTFLFADGDNIIGCDSLANTEIDAPVNTNISYHEPRFYNMSLSGTSVRTELGSNTTNVQLIKTNDRNYPSSKGTTLTLKSKSNEISGTTITKSLVARHVMSSQNRFTSPAIDLQSQSLLVYENVINNDTTNEHLSEKGSASSKYVSRVVTLAEGLDAEDIKVFVNAYKPANTDIKVYAKILNEADSLSVADTNWSQLQATQNKDTFSSEKERKDIIEYGFEFADTLETTAVDAVATTVTNGTTVSFTSNVFSSFANNDMIKLTDSNANTDYQISKVVTMQSNGTHMTLDANGLVNSSSIAVSKVNTDQINRAFRDPQAPTAFQATYYNTNNEKFVGYKRLAIKIVMTSESTAKAPVLQDYRAIAVSL